MTVNGSPEGKGRSNPSVIEGCDQMFARASVRTVIGVLAVLGAVRGLAQGSFTNFETPQVHPVDLSPNRSLLAVCNTADYRVELFDVSSGIPNPIASIPVGVDPVTARFRNNLELWVVNHVSDSISVIDVPTRRVRATIPTLDEPCDVVFAGTPVYAFVSCSQANTVQRFDPVNIDAPPVNIPIEAEDPRALAVSPDRQTVYAAIFESGNSSTIIAGGADGTLPVFPPDDAMNDPQNPYGGVNPPPNDPFDSNGDGNLFLPPKNPNNGTPPRVGLIVKKDPAGVWRDDNAADWTPWISGAKAQMSGRPPGWDLIDRDVAVIDTATLNVTYIERLMNLCMAIAVNPGTGRVTVVGTDCTNEIRFEPVIRGRFLRVNFASAAPGQMPPAIVDLNFEHLSAAQPGGDPYADGLVPQNVRDKSLGDPRGIVWNAAGTLGFITGMGSNNLIAVNASGHRAFPNQTTELREGPTGLALDEPRQRLYVLNRFHGSVSVVDTVTLTEIANVPFFDPTPPVIKIGRKHLYDTHKNSGLGHIACASCHVDARMDRLAWDLGDPADNIKPLSGAGSPPQHNLGAGIPGLRQGNTSPAFENFHPMKGPMTTQTLVDIIGKEPHHWRGDRDGLEEFNPAFMNLQGDDQMLTIEPSGGEMQEFENFLATIHVHPNPFRNFDNTLPTDLPLPHQFANGRFAGQGGLPPGAPLPNGNAVRGLELYRNQNAPLDAGNFTCVICHTLPTGAGTDSTLVGAAFQPIPPGPKGERHLALVSVDGSTNRAIKVPHLRNQFDKAGFELTPGNVSLAGFGVLHDGSIDSISRFVSEGVFQIQSDQDQADLTALILSFSGGFAFAPPNPGPFPEAPGVTSKDAHAAVGKQSTLGGQKDITLVNSMLALADAGQVDVIVKGNIDGYARGWQYLGSDLFRSDWSQEPLRSRNQVIAIAGIGSELTFTVVPIGAAARTGIDRDEDGTLDFDEFLASDRVPPAIVLSVAKGAAGAVNVTARLSEPSTNFAIGDVTATNASVSNFQGSGRNYQFTVTPAAGGDATVRVRGGQFTDYAGNPNQPSNTLTISDGPGGTLKIKKPNGGETWPIGEKGLIRWTSTGETGSKVKLELWRNGNFVRNIKAKTDNDGKQRWRVPEDVAAGAGYKVRIVSKANPSIQDSSNNSFQISN